MTDDTDVPESPLREALPEVGPPGAADPLDVPEPASMRFDDVPEPMGLKGVLPEVSSDLPEPQHVPTNVQVPTGLSESPTIPVPMDQAKPFLEAEEPVEDAAPPEESAPEAAEPEASEPEPEADEPEPVAGAFGGADDDLDFPDEPSDDAWAAPVDDEPPPEKKSMLPLFGGLIALVLVGGVGAVLFMNGGDEPEPEPVAEVAKPAEVEPTPAPVAEPEPVVEEPVVEEPVEEPEDDALVDAEEPEVEEPEPVVERQPTRTKAKSSSTSGGTAERAAPADDPWGTSGEDVQPANVALRIKTQPAGATIFVDGRSVGTSPTTVDVEPGRHDVRAEMAGYTTTSIATMAEGSATDALVTLKKEGPAKAAVTLFGPAGAQVFLGGASIGYLPVQTELALGSHEFKVVTAEGTFYKVTQSVTADGGSIALLPN